MGTRRIATRVSQLNGEGALAVFSRAKELEKQGHSIIHLELGEPDFHPAPPVVDAMRSAVAGGRDRYCATRGIPALREEIAAYLKRTRRIDVKPEEVLVAPGCKMALSLAMMALIEPGDEVLYPDPGFPIYPSFTRGLGAKAIPFALSEKNKFQPDLNEIGSKITPKTSVLIYGRCVGSRISRKNTICGCSATKFMRASFLAANIFHPGLCLEWPSALSSLMGSLKVSQ